MLAATVARLLLQATQLKPQNMKSILYVGATLMIGASIYGFVDYKKTSHSKEFTGMYESKEPVIVKENPATPVEEKTEPMKTEKRVSRKKSLPAEEPVITKSKIEITAAEKMESESELTETAKLKENKSLEKIKKTKKRKLDTKLFSRAPLREEIEVADLPVPSKKETKKATVKEL